MESNVFLFKPNLLKKYFVSLHLFKVLGKEAWFAVRELIILYVNIPKNWGYDDGGIQIETTFLHFINIDLTSFLVNFGIAEDTSPVDEISVGYVLTVEAFLVFVKILLLNESMLSRKDILEFLVRAVILLSYKLVDLD